MARLPSPAEIRRRARRIRRQSTNPEVAGRRVLARVWIALAVLFGLAAVQAWLADFLTMEHTWTLYTARCADAGCRRLDGPGDRIRFHVEPASGSVSHRVLRRDGATGVMTGCNVLDARHWSCPAALAASAAVPSDVVDGQATHTSALPYAVVSKFHWLWLHVHSG
jgi:hypothetical protein